MTVAEVMRRVEQIRAIAGDDEAAHAAEDALWRDVLTSIAEGTIDPQGLAQMALLTPEIPFARWCA